MVHHANRVHHVQLAYLDRANFSFASAAGINEDLGITKGISSLLGALFFLGYFFSRSRAQFTPSAAAYENSFLSA